LKDNLLRKWFMEISNRIKFLWYLTCFRFFISIGKNRWAQKAFNRIQLPEPEPAMNEMTFQVEERKKWMKYEDERGNLRLITWKSFFASMLKVITLGVLIFVLIFASYKWTSRIKQLEADLSEISITELQPHAAQKLQLIDGEAIEVDMRRRPVFSNKQLYLPTVITSGEKENVLYIPGENFLGDSMQLNDCSMVRKFIFTSGEIIYYIYQEDIAEKGTWMNQVKFDEFKAKIDPGTGIFISPGDNLSRRLRDKPHRDAKVLYTVPAGNQVEFIKFAPISSISSNMVWLLVKYTNEGEPGKCQKGWIAAVSIDRLYIDIETGTNTLKIIANSLTIGEKPETNAVLVSEVNRLLFGEKVEFLGFASPSHLLSGNFVKIQIRYTYTDENNKQKTVKGWIPAGKIDKKLITGVEKLKTKSRDNGSPIKK
jgi:hypothetical protein